LLSSTLLLLLLTTKWYCELVEWINLASRIIQKTDHSSFVQLLELHAENTLRREQIRMFPLIDMALSDLDWEVQFYEDQGHFTQWLWKDR
jgi:hypothetical protein